MSETKLTVMWDKPIQIPGMHYIGNELIISDHLLEITFWKIVTLSEALGEAVIQDNSINSL